MARSGWPRADGAYDTADPITPTARATPLSARIFSPRAAARSRTRLSSVAIRIARRSVPAVSFFWGMGSGPTPNSDTRLPQNSWSFIVVGQITLGLPARKPSAVVPAPPCCTTAAIRGNSHSWGAEPITQTSSDTPEGTRPAPVASTPRLPDLRRALNAAPTTLSEIHPPRLPKPTYTGGGPPSRKSARWAGGCQSPVRSRNQYPVMVVQRSQSAGGDTTCGLQEISVGTGSPRSSSSLASKRRGGNPRVSSRQRLMVRWNDAVDRRKKAP